MESRDWKLPFFTIWTGQALSLVGSALVQFALIWWLTETTGSAAVLATASLVAFLPPALLGPLVGALVDRWRRRWIMVVADGSIALFTALLALLFWRGTVEVWHVYAILALRALGSAFHEPAMTASTTLMVPDEHLTRVAGLDQTRAGVTRMGGPVLGALLLAILPIQGVLGIDILTALLAIVPLLFIDVPQPASAASQGGGMRRSVIRETAEGLRYIWSWRGLFTAIATGWLLGFFGRPRSAVIPLLVKEHFGGGPAEWAWFTITFNAGFVLGGILMSTWGGLKRRMANTVITLFVLGVTNLIRGVTPSGTYWLFLVATFALGVTAPMYYASWKAILQSAVPPEMQGRVFSTESSLGSLGGTLGLAILGPMADAIGAQTLFLLGGAASLLVAFTWTFTPSVRNLEDGPPKKDESG